MPSSDRKADLKNERNDAEEIDLNQVQQQSPDSSHSSDNNKDIVKETSELRVRNNVSFIICYYNLVLYFSKSIVISSCFHLVMSLASFFANGTVSAC